MFEFTTITCLKILIILSALLAISVYNPVHSVLFLVVVFIYVSILLLFLGIEFLAFAFLVVYIGAISVLFLFVVMMLNIQSLRQQPNTPLIFIGIVISFISYTIATWFSDVFHITIQSPLHFRPLTIESQSNLVNIGVYLFKQVPLSFLCVGLILFVAMCGAIILTLHHSSGIRRQQIFQQNAQKQFILLPK